MICRTVILIGIEGEMAFMENAIQRADTFALNKALSTQFTP